MTVSMMRDITQSAAKQRAGRAGRTRAGVCFRLYSEEKFEGMHPFKQAEILRMNLDNVVLKIKMFNVKNLLQFPFLEKPDQIYLTDSLENLKMIGAIDENEDITSIGELMVQLPTEPAISRAILESIFRRCEEEVIRIIGLMSSCHNLFMRINP